MAYNDEFASGIDHQQADGRFNPMSQSLQAIGQSWTAQVANEAAAPHSLLVPLNDNPEHIGYSGSTMTDFAGDPLTSDDGQAATQYGQTTLRGMVGDDAA